MNSILCEVILKSHQMTNLLIHWAWRASDMYVILNRYHINISSNDSLDEQQWADKKGIGFSSPKIFPIRWRGRSTLLDTKMILKWSDAPKRAVSTQWLAYLFMECSLQQANCSWLDSRSIAAQPLSVLNWAAKRLHFTPYSSAHSPMFSSYLDDSSVVGIDENRNFIWLIVNNKVWKVETPCDFPRSSYVAWIIVKRFHSQCCHRYDDTTSNIESFNIISTMMITLDTFCGNFTRSCHFEVNCSLNTQRRFFIDKTKHLLVNWLNLFVITTRKASPTRAFGLFDNLA